LVNIKPTTMIPFDLEKFKAGAIAVDFFGRDVTFHSVSDGYLGYSFIKDGEKWNGAFTNSRTFLLESALKHWHMKHSPKWIVFREFDSEEEAKMYFDANLPLFGWFAWKIEKQ